MANVWAIVAKLFCSNPEVAKELAEKAPELLQVIADAAGSFVTQAFDAEKVSKNNRHEMEVAVLHALEQELQNPQYSLEEKLFIVEKMEDLLESSRKQDAMEKEHELKILQFAAGTLLGGPVFLVGYAGVKIYQNRKQEEHLLENDVA